LAGTLSLKNGGANPRGIGKSPGKGWRVPRIVIGSLVTYQSIGIGEKEVGVKHDSLVGRTFSKFI
jgi:hypothetical protein